MSKYYLLQLAMFLSIQIKIIYNATNLVCNGDFQGHTLHSDLFSQPYVWENSNYSCWYNKNGSQVQFKQKVNPPSTTTVQLVLTTPYILCQNVSLTVGQSYNLSYDIVNCFTMTYSTVMANINNVWIKNVSAYNQLSKSSGWVLFSANSSSNMLCFDSVFHITNTLFYGNNGPCIDNVTITSYVNTTNIINNTNIPIQNNTIIPIQNSTVNNITNPANINNPSSLIPANYPSYSNIDKKSIVITCTATTLNQTLQAISFYCNYQSGGVDIFLQKYGMLVQIYFEGQRQYEFSFVDIQSTWVKFNVYPNRAYYLRNIILGFPQNQLPPQFQSVKFQLIINGVAIVAMMLNDQQRRVITNMGPVSQFIVSYVEKIYVIMKASFFSYFLIDIISFWNLSIMYNFLNITTVPAFSRNFLQRLVKLLFKIDSIIGWICQQFPVLQSILSFPSDKIRELMNNFENGYAWFGFFGFTSNFLNNNIEQILLIGILCIKIGLMYFIRKLPILPRFLKNRMPKGINLQYKFFHELISLQIFMIISAGTTMLNYSFINHEQKFNSMYQLLTLFVCEATIILFFIVDLQVQKQKASKKFKQNNKSVTFKLRTGFSNNKSSNRRVILTVFNRNLQQIPYIMIPVFILLKNSKAFLTINTVILSLRCYWFFKSRKYLLKNCRQKLFITLNIMVWIIHHLTYVSMWVVEKIYQVNKQISKQSIQNINQSLKIMGFITIFTVLLGGVLQIINFILQISTSAIKFIIQCFRINKYKKNEIKNDTVQNMQKKKKPLIIIPQLKIYQSKHIGLKGIVKFQNKHSNCNNKDKQMQKQMKKRVDNNMHPKPLSKIHAYKFRVKPADGLSISQLANIKQKLCNISSFN